MSVDMDEANLEEMLLAFRISGGESGKKFAAFDLLLSKYWATFHPEQDLDAFLASSGWMQSLSRRVGLSSVVQSGLQEALGVLIPAAMPVAMIVNVVSTLTRSGWNRALSNNALRACEILPDLLVSIGEGRERLSLAAYGLSWDLAVIQRKTSMPMVVFIDTFESTSQDLEKRVNEVAWLMPNVLFVVASRNRICWAEESSRMPRFGPAVWPGLAEGAISDPRQHRVGFISPADCRSFLHRALPDPLDEALLVAAVDASGGLPLHLDLLVQRVAQISGQRSVNENDLTASLPDLAVRIFKDLSSLERRALLGACIFDCFDVDLAQAASALPNGGPVIAITQKALVATNGNALFPYGVHDNLRQTFLSALHLGEDQWTAKDWNRGAVRGLDELIHRFDKEDLSSKQRLIARTIFATAATFGLADQRLVIIAHTITRASGWPSDWSVEVLCVEGVADTWVQALAVGIGLVMTRQNRARDEVANDLRRVLASHPDAPELDVLRYFLVECLRDTGDLDGSRELINQLRSKGSGLAPRAIHAEIHLLRREGRFGTAAQLLRLNRDILPHYDRLFADISWAQASFEESATSYLQAAEASMARGDVGEQGTCFAGAAFAISFVDPVRARNWAEDSSKSLKIASVSFSTLQARLALVLGSDWRHVPNAISELGDIAGEAKLLRHSSIVAYSHFAACLISGLRETVVYQKHFRLLSEIAEQGQFQYLVEILNSCTAAETGNKTTNSAPATEWADDEVLARWRGVVETRRING
ncbi:hypothetical protein E3T46_00995 [Cryobacterium sp. Hh11]|uniref:hypothetical protein n=1 Tax=Cryobacterium sp. Hh11 TaxID=2555868 RepID=UPI001069E877|nr:hypothetical protein [Cryobacterium sp. Hh11]TFD54266.1 hypothetical protein E3T46_00995 [Cryobacterium sp. Hh11]